MSPPSRTPTPKHRALALGLQFTISLTAAHMLATAEVAAILFYLTYEMVDVGSDLFDGGNQRTGFVVCGLGVLAVAGGGAWIIVPSLIWYSKTAPPSAAEVRGALRIANRQSILILLTWSLGAAVFVLSTLEADPGAALMVGVAAIFGGITTMGTSYLMTQHILRPLSAAAMKVISAPVASRAPGVLSRLVTIWVLCSALPTAGIATLVVIRSYGWIVDERALLSAPILVIAIVALLVGLRATILVARTISDPIGDVVLAMKAVRRGDFGTDVAVYESSEIGELQDGFNRMTAGLAERERLRDLFGRHVGGDVAERALELSSTDGDVLDVAVLFVDLTDFTSFAAVHPPQAVAEVLNEFLQIVVAIVDDHHGWINKFIGDAALAVFGAPRQLDDAAGAALASGRGLATALATLTNIDFGVGVAAGRVFAGNVGSQRRYEYTVVGDPVNEAARLADVAKSRECRVLGTQHAVNRSGEAERGLWVAQGEMLLRGRPVVTKIFAPRALSGVDARPSPDPGLAAAGRKSTAQSSDDD